MFQEGALKYKQKNNRDFDILQFKKYKNFTDHQGNYITVTGHKIDDFLLSSGRDLYGGSSSPATKSSKINNKSYCVRTSKK